MPVDVAKVKDELLAQSALNEDAITAYLTAYPTFDIGDTYLDGNGLTWKIKFLYAVKNSVIILACYIDDLGAETSTFQQFYPARAQLAYVSYNFLYPLATLSAPYTIVFGTDVQYGELLELTIDGGLPLIVGTDYDWNPVTSTLTMYVNTTVGQILSFTYKKRPYYYGYSMGL